MTVDVRDGYRRKGFGRSLALAGPFALLMVDFCNAFVDGELLGGGNIKVAATQSLTLLEEARRRGWPIAHSQIVFDSGQLQTNVWVEKVPALGVLIEENSSSSFTTELAPLAGEKVIRKAVPSAFFDSNLKDWLSERRVRSIVIAGCTTSGCVRASAIDAISNGFRPIIAVDCVGDRLLAAHHFLHAIELRAVGHRAVRGLRRTRIAHDECRGRLACEPLDLRKAYARHEDAVGALQDWPMLRIPAATAAGLARAKSASGRMTLGELPPSSAPRA